jgi:hypothetical protein
MNIFRSLGFAIGVFAVPAASSMAQETTDALDALRERGKEFCFGRINSSAHMARHKQQRLSAFFLFRDFSPDPFAENKPIPRERLIVIDKSSAPRKIDVVSRNRAGRISHWDLDCEETNGEFTCSGSSADEDSVLEIRPSKGALLVKNGLEEARYRLVPLPVSTCLAWRDRARPSWVGQGPPLRVRFAEHAPACFMREYDVQHLARHPGQRVAAVAAKILRPVEIDERDQVRHTMLRATLSLRLRDGTLVERHTRCDGAGYDFWCQYGHGSVHLAPAGDRSIMMFDRQSNDRDENQMELFFGAPLGRKGQIFRLDARSDTPCELRPPSEVRPQQ